MNTVLIKYTAIGCDHNYYQRYYNCEALLRDYEFLNLIKEGFTDSFSYSILDDIPLLTLLDAVSRFWKDTKSAKYHVENHLLFDEAETIACPILIDEVEVIEIIIHTNSYTFYKECEESDIAKTILKNARDTGILKDYTNYEVGKAGHIIKKPNSNNKLLSPDEELNNQKVDSGTSDAATKKNNFGGFHF